MQNGSNSLLSIDSKLKSKFWFYRRLKGGRNRPKFCNNCNDRLMQNNNEECNSSALQNNDCSCVHDYDADPSEVNEEYMRGFNAENFRPPSPMVNVPQLHVNSPVRLPSFIPAARPRTKTKTKTKTSSSCMPGSQPESRSQSSIRPAPACESPVNSNDCSTASKSSSRANRSKNKSCSSPKTQNTSMSVRQLGRSQLRGLINDIYNVY